MNEKYVRNKMQLALVKSQLQSGKNPDYKILGSGPLNRDGHPQIPPEQKSVERWPVLDLGIHPDIELKDWTLDILGLCSKPQKLNWSDLQKLPQTEDTSDFHCVTGWSKLGIRWRGVRFADIAQAAGVGPEAKHIFVRAYDDYSVNVSLSEALKYDVLLVYEADGQPLAREHGGPVRMITPQLWAWKGAKWIRSIEFLKQDRRGFWEERGYSNSAIPWLNDRYTATEQSED